MNMDFDVNKVFQDRLVKSIGLDKYHYIMKQVMKTNVSTDIDFQRTFNAFYVVRRNNEWRKIYYSLFEEVKTKTPSFSSIITHLYQCTGNIEPSFSSKMLASIFPEKPIWDKYVLQSLHMELVGNTKEERLHNAIILYSNIEKWYEDFLQTPKAKECIETFDRIMSDYKHISNIKKMDSILWSIR